jgi:hypothetical protein
MSRVALIVSSDLDKVVSMAVQNVCTSVNPMQASALQKKE